MDEFAASDNFYLFQPPLFYRLPSNTDELFSDYINNPGNYQDNTIPKDYILQRHYDLLKDLEDVRRQGMSEDNAKKFYFYSGLVSSFSNLLQEMLQAESLTILQSRILELRNNIQTDLDNIKALGTSSENGLKYNYYKGKLTAYEQVLLNSNIVPL